MPRADPEKRRAAERAYAKTPHGKAARKRAKDSYRQRMKGKTSDSWRPEPNPLIDAINQWSRT